ncbi:MAG: hypothetical protein JXA06_02365 [Bacteroidetes bacterium]|nr:hypothetical protein [Bacteroidota bacterium]
MKNAVYFILILLITPLYSQEIESDIDSICTQLIKLSLQDQCILFNKNDNSSTNIGTLYILDSCITKEQLPDSSHCCFVIISTQEIKALAENSDFYYHRLSRFTLNKDTAQIVWEDYSVVYENNQVSQRLADRISRKYHLTTDGWQEGMSEIKTFGYGIRASYLKRK